MIRAVAFDVMDTLLSDPFREALLAATGLGLEELRERRDPTLYPAFERGEIAEDRYWRGHRDRGIPVDPQAFHRVRREGTRWLPGMRRLVDEVRTEVRCVTASNYPVWIEELAEGPLAGRFDQVIASHHLGVRKPDDDFFAALLGSLSLPASAVAFVDDRPANVEAAQRHGLPALLFTSAVETRRWLRSLGVAVGSAGETASDLDR